jgi:hypothetical protein
MPTQDDTSQQELNRMEDTTAPADAGAPPDAAASPPPLPLDHLIETWWADHFPGSPVAQVTQAWNHAFAAKEELKRRLSDFTANRTQGVH